MKRRDLGKILAGTIVGTGIGILFARKSGEEMRKDLDDKMHALLENVKNINSDGVRKEFKGKVKKIRDEVKSLDGEKALSIAKEKAKEVKRQADSLVFLAKDKGDEVLEKCACEVRSKAIEITKKVLDKLEG